MPRSHSAPTACSVAIAFFAASGYAWTLRREYADEPLSAGWALAHALLGASALASLCLLWITFAADPGYLTPSAVPDAAWLSVTNGVATGESCGW